MKISLINKSDEDNVIQLLDEKQVVRLDYTQVLIYEFC